MPLYGPPLNDSIVLSEILAKGLAAKPDEPAVVSAQMRWTWRELDQASTCLAKNLIGLGLQSGDRVASLMPNRGALLVHYLACIKAGLVSTPLNYRYMPPEMDHALGVSGASILFAHAERADDIAASELAGQLPLGFVSYGGDLGQSPRFEDLIKGPEPDIDLASVPQDAPAFIFFTSGSTGKPKGVTHTHETFGWMLASCSESLELNQNDILLPGSSISHIGSLMTSLGGLGVGARVDVARTFDADEILPLLRETRPTVLLMLPAALITLVRDHDAKPEDFASVRLCISGGDKVSAELEREFEKIAGLSIDEVYGMTEIGLSNVNPPSGVNKLGSIGPAGYGYALSIRDDDGNEVSAGVDGRLWVKASADMVAYWDNPKATEETIQDGWLDTGDVMTADEDGYLWFRGRKKQIIIHDGSNICPQEVEEVLLEHVAVESAGVIGIHDLVHGENVRAYITLKDGAERPVGQDLIQFARARVGYKAPESIVVLEDMPLNATGKVDRVTLKRLAADEHAQGADSG